MKIKLGLLAIAWLQCITAWSAEPGADSIATLQLKNGMTILVWPVHNIPNVALYNFVHVGSRNEVTGRTGLAHFFEHMMFNGTATRAQGEFDRVMEAQGGENNASTSEDVTVYQDAFPSTALATIFELEADRLQNLAFVPEVVERERQVVYSERRLRIEDDVAAHLQEQIQATAFLAHPYGMPVIGWPTDIQAWTMDDLKQFFKSRYVPNNCTLVIVGDVQVKEVFRLAQHYFEPLAARPLPAPPHTIEPVQQGERNITLNIPAQTPLLQFAYHGVNAMDADLPALEVLLRILTSGDSSRLYQALVEQQLAISVDASVERSFDPNLVWFMLTLPENGNVNNVEQAFDAELERVMVSGITAAELHKARNILLSEYWQQLATIDGKAAALGNYAVFAGDYHALFAMPELYEQVTAEQVQQVARRLLQKYNRTVGALIPATSGAAKADR